MKRQKKKFIIVFNTEKVWLETTATNSSANKAAIVATDLIAAIKTAIAVAVDDAYGPDGRAVSRRHDRRY